MNEYKESRHQSRSQLRDVPELTILEVGSMILVCFSTRDFSTEISSRAYTVSNNIQTWNAIIGEDLFKIHRIYQS